MYFDYQYFTVGVRGSHILELKKKERWSRGIAHFLYEKSLN